ncbi:MAG: hypothetical protein ACOYCE_07835 [Limnochordia bacterium]|jgi:RinA family phage transcriptional activator
MGREIRLVNLRLIEAEIRHYHDTIQELQELEREIAAPSIIGDFSERIPSTSPGDSTAKQALHMMTSTELLELRRRVEAIERMLGILKAHPEQGRYELIKLTYWSNGRCNVEGICRKLKISPRTYHRWKREALEIIGERLGWKI